VKDEKLTPRITETATALWFTYLAITVVGIVSLRVAGMSWFDAICHCMSAIALGGFSTHDTSIGFFGSFGVELVLIAIMLVGALNFSRHFLAMRNLSLDPYRRDSEAKAVLILLGSSVLLVSTLLWLDGAYGSEMEAFRHSVFNVVSIATTTGFVTEDYEKWPAFLPVWLIFLSCITCSTGSTGGGIKMFRTLLLVRQARRELKLLVHPSAIIPIRIGGVAVPDRVRPVGHRA
jgi:trk system potassium uptake protein TrkH